MKILALEFSSPVRSAAIAEAVGGEVRILGRAQSAFGDGDRRSSDALSLVDEALRAARIEREQVDCVAVGLGPGSYAGIRGAISLAQGWQLATGTRLLGINSAECLATQARAEGLTGRVGIVIDAQRQEFYFAGYDVGAVCREVEPLRLASLDEVRQRQAKGAILAGPEVVRWFPAGRVILPLATALAQLAGGRSNFLRGEQLEPVYLRATQFVKAPPPRALPRS
jgi:tRNA threonylcarbamoyl adenosine modification protein YeaZ